MQPMQALASGRGCRPACDEHGLGSCLRGLERGQTAAMEQAGIVEAGHDRHKSIKSRAVFLHPSVARRAERRQADADRMREGRLRLAARAGHAKSQPGPLAVAQSSRCRGTSRWQ